jgi:hypothetical protein
MICPKVLVLISSLVLVLFSDLALVPHMARAKRLALEEVYQQVWCEARGGDMEVRLADGARIDCLVRDLESNGTMAIEFDFTDKWAEAIGQSLYYAKVTGSRPGIVLIMEDVNTTAVKHLARLMRTVSGEMAVWVVFSGHAAVRMR